MQPDLAVVEAEAAREINEGRYEQAFRKYSVVADKGSGTAQLRLGWMYETGNGVQRDLEKAEQWYAKAAVTTGSPDAQFYLANLYRRTERYKRAVEPLEKAAAQGYPPALYALGQMYNAGTGVPADRQKAFDYFEEAARKGHLFALRNVAREMISGRRGVSRVLAGIGLMIKVYWRAIKLTKNEPDSDLAKY